MTQEQRDHLHSNTAAMMDHVSEKKIKVLYLAQQYKIKPSYAKAIFDLLSKKDFEFSEVEKES
jgi:catalase